MLFYTRTRILTSMWSLQNLKLSACAFVSVGDTSGDAVRRELFSSTTAHNPATLHAIVPYSESRCDSVHLQSLVCINTRCKKMNVTLVSSHISKDTILEHLRLWTRAPSSKRCRIGSTRLAFDHYKVYVDKDFKEIDTMCSICFRTSTTSSTAVTSSTKGA